MSKKLSRSVKIMIYFELSALRELLLHKIWTFKTQNVHSEPVSKKFEIFNDARAIKF